jgi:hypothetical protein
MNQLERLREDLARLVEGAYWREDASWMVNQMEQAARTANAIRAFDLTPYAVQDGEVAEHAKHLRWTAKHHAIAESRLEEIALFIERQSAELREARKALEMLDRRLIVDVKLEPATYILAGCKIRTVVIGLSADYRSTPVTGEPK